MSSQWFAVRQELTSRRYTVLTASSFLLPLLIWCLLSYVPFLWHPMVSITDKGSVSYFKSEMLVEKDLFYEELIKAEAEGRALPQGDPANPIYFPAPHEVAEALYTAFTTEPKRRSEQWLHESLADSISVIFWGFFISSLIGVPLGILAGTYSAVSRLSEPFIEFFRYLPAD